MLIEVSIVDNYNVQVIASNPSVIRISEDIQAEISHHVINRKSITLKVKSEVVIEQQLNDNIITSQVKLALEKIYALKNDEQQFEVSHDAFLKFIPMFNKQDKTRYLLCAQNNFDNVTLLNKSLCIDIEQDYDFKSELQAFSTIRENNYLMLNSKVSGNYDAMHIIKLIHRLFLIQLYSTDSNLLNVVVNIACENGVFVQAKQYDCNQVSVIDATAKLTNGKELYIEKMLKDEVQSNLKLFKQYC